MYKPNNWDDIKPASSLSPDPGYYILKFLDVQEGFSENGNERLSLHFDIAYGEFANHYTNLSASLGKHITLMHWQPTGTESSLPFFKKLILDIEKSNPGYKFDFNPKSLIGKKIGAKLHIQISDKNGKSYAKIKSFYSVDEVRVLIDSEKNKSENNSQPINDNIYQAPTENNNSFEVNDDDLPF